MLSLPALRYFSNDNTKIKKLSEPSIKKESPKNRNDL